MAKQPKNTDNNVATDQNPIEEIAGTVQPETPSDQTDNTEMQAAQVPPASGKAGSVASDDSEQGSGDSTTASGGENPEMDTQAKNKGTGEQGGDTESREINNEQEAREFVREIVTDELSRALTMAQANVDEKDTEAKEPTKADKERARIAGDIFEKNPNKANVLYFAGMIPFWNESDAERHAKSLADKTIVTITKQQ